MNHTPTPALPSPADLRRAMIELGCQVAASGWCGTHNSSLMIHDGGRVACTKAWEVLS